MKTLALFLSLFVTSLAVAGPLTLKDKKGREITVTVTDYNVKTVTFKKGAKEYTVPWNTFDQASIDLIKSTPLPGADNKRQERQEELQDEAGAKVTVTIPAGQYLSKAGMLELYIGDTVHLEFQMADGQLSAKDPIIVVEVKKPEQTMTFEFINDRGTPTLKRSSKIQKTVAFDCQIQTNGSAEFTKEKRIAPTNKGKSDEFAWLPGLLRIQFSNFSVNDRSIDDEYADRIK